MSIPESNGKIALITGVNGYIAQVIGQRLLTAGYSIRGTSRRVASSQSLLDGPWKVYEKAGRVEIVEVPVMTVSGAFDAAVQGVHSIFHTASPISNKPPQNYDTVIAPAVGGALTLLNSALTAGPQLESVVITSSVAAISNPESPPGTVIDETWWNDWALPKAKQLGAEAPPGLLYSASKATAERAVWAWREEKKPAFAITSVLPTYVIGPPTVLPKKHEDLNLTLDTVAKIFLGIELEPPVGTGMIVDVRDTAEVHVRAMEKGKAADGQRYIASQGKGSPQAMADLLHARYPQRKEIMPLGEPESDYIKVGDWDEIQPKPGQILWANEKSRKELGITYRSFKETLLDTAKAFETAYL